MKILNINTPTGIQKVFEYAAVEKEIEAGPDWFLLPAIIDPYATVEIGEDVALKSGIEAIFEARKTSRPRQHETSALLRSAWLDLDRESFDNLEGSSGIAGYRISARLLKDASLASDLFMRAAQDNLPLLFDMDENPQSVEEALFFTEEYATHLLVASISQNATLDLIESAKASEVLVSTCTSPWHLNHYPDLWNEIASDRIDMVASGSKSRPEDLMPFYLKSIVDGRISLEKASLLSRARIEEDFALERRNCWTIIDMKEQKVIFTFVENNIY